MIARPMICHKYKRMNRLTYPTDVLAGWTDQRAHNMIVDAGIVDVKDNLQQHLLTPVYDTSHD